MEQNLKSRYERNTTATLNSLVTTLQKKETLAKFLAVNRIATSLSIEDVLLFDPAPDRRILIATILEGTEKDRTKIFIDLRADQPSIDQVHEAVYGKGKDCTKRIIGFTGWIPSSDDEDPGAGENVVASLIATMNAFSLQIHLLWIDSELQSQPADLEPFEPEDDEIHPMSELPSELRFRETEFWLVYYSSIYDQFYEEQMSFTDMADKEWMYREWWDINGLRVQVEWNEEGAFFSVRQGDWEDDNVTKFWNAKQTELRSRFADRPVQILTLPEKLPRINIRFWDLPISWLLTASNEEKMSRARLLQTEFREFVEYMEIALREVKEADSGF